MARFDFFISHHQTDAGAEASLLAETLRNQGLRVFLDVDTHQVGDLEHLTKSALEDSKGVVVLVGPNFAERVHQSRAWVRLELEAARRAKKDILPVVLPESERELEKLPESLAWFGRTRWIRFDRTRVSAIVEELTSAFAVRSRAASGPGVGWLVLMILLAVLLGMVFLDAQKKEAQLEVARTKLEAAERQIEGLRKDLQDLRSEPKR